MATVGLILLVIGFIISFVAGIWLLYVAFQESLAWGLGSLLCNIVALIFVIMHWAEARRPFLINLGGLALVFIGSMMGGTERFADDSEGDSEAAALAMIEAEMAADEAAVETAETARTSALSAGRPTTNAIRSPLAPPRATNASRTLTNFARRATNRLPARPVPLQTVTSAPPLAATMTAPEAPPVSTAPAVAREPTTAPATPEPASLLLPGNTVPLEVEVISLGQDDGSGLRPMDLRMVNHTRKTIKQVRLTLIYLDQRRFPIKEWSTSIFDPSPKLTSGATVKLRQPAFFMPVTTVSVGVRVTALTFDDGTRWPE